MVIETLHNHSLSRVNPQFLPFKVEDNSQLPSSLLCQSILKPPQFTQVPGGSKSAVLDGLEKGTKYLIRLQSINNKGTGDFESESIQVKTDGGKYQSMNSFIRINLISSKLFFLEV